MSLPYTLLPSTSNDQAAEWISLATEAYKLKQLDKAEHYNRRALRIKPCDPVANNNLAVVLACKGNVNEALLAAERASIFDNNDACIAANLALAYFEVDRIDEARAVSRAAVALAPDRVEDDMKMTGYMRSRLAYAVVAASAGKPHEAIPMYNDMLAVEPTHAAAGPNCCFVQTLCDLGPKELLEQRKVVYEANRWKGKYWPHRNTKQPDRTLRIGYVSGDYKSHSAAMIFSNVLFNHDRELYTPYLYSTMPVEPDKDDMTQRFIELGNWRDVSDKSDDDLEGIIENDAIDILVDLSGHTNGGKLWLFTRRPAPIQVTAWGFAHGTGCPEIDYFFADQVAVPEHERHYYAEKIWDLPCIVTYLPRDEYAIPETSPLPYRKNEYITFGSFSRFEKLSDECLASFNQILKAVPNSRLYLKDHAFRRPYSIRRVLAGLPDVDQNRVIFGTATAHPDHMREYQNVDIVLDPFPHGGGNVVLEVLYTGVPIITRYGRQAAGRTASSVLTTLGGEEWIARSDEEYVEKAVEWSKRPDDLAAARKTLRADFINSPIVNGYAKSVESAYRAMWQKYCESPR